MQDKITVMPLVDILSEQLGEQVVKSGTEYVYYKGFLPVEQDLVSVAKLEQEKLNGIQMIEICKTSLMTLCDKKQNDVQNMLLGYKATPAQLERYKDKYERARLGEFDEATNALIIQNHESYLSSIRAFIDLIELFRSEVDDLIIENNLERANELIELASDFDETTTLEQIQELFQIN